MHYKFPHITHINDVLPAIEGRSEFIVADRGTHTILNYVVVMSDSFPPMHTAGGSAKMREAQKLMKALRRECRGITFDKDGNIIRRTYHKFFNINERDETLEKNLDFSAPHIILEKLDGSMIAPYMVDDRLIWGTKMGDTDVAIPVQDFVNSDYVNFAEFCINYKLTPIFEWCSRKQAIVIDHPVDRLVLTGIREFHSGAYILYNDMVKIAGDWNIPVVKALDANHASFAELVKFMRESIDDVEGAVVRWNDGMMVKVKTDRYCAIHKARDAVNEEKAVVEYILDERLDDVLPMVPDLVRANLERFRDDFFRHLGDAVVRLETSINHNYKSFPDRKTYALSGNAKMDSDYDRTATFKFFDTKFTQEDLRNHLIGIVRNNLGTRTKFNEMKNHLLPHLYFYV